MAIKHAQAETPPSRFFRSPWYELAYLASLVMELSWMALWLHFFLQAGTKLGYWQVFSVVGVLMAGAYIVTRLLSYFDVSMFYRRLVTGLVIIAGILAGFAGLLYSNETGAFATVISRLIHITNNFRELQPGEFMIMIVMIFVIWRGITWVDKPIGPFSVQMALKLGVAAFFAYGIFVPISPTTPLISLYLFLFFSLLAMSFARIAVSSRLRGGQQIHFDRNWLVGIVLFSGIIVWLAASGGFALQGKGVDFLFDIFARLVLLLAIIFSPLAWLLAQVLLLLGRWLRIDLFLDALIELFHRLQAVAIRLTGTVRSWLGDVDRAGIEAFFRKMALARPALFWGIIIIFCILVILSVRRHFWRREEVEEGEYQSLLVQEDLFGMIWGAFRHRLDDLAERLAQVGQLRFASRLLAAARVRRIYAQLMKMSAKMGHPRPVAHTPLEFMEELGQFLPDVKPELQSITSAYVRVRYGDLPETRTEIKTVEEAWRRVASAGRMVMRVSRSRRESAHIE